MLDLDSPILKVIRYLEHVSEGKPVDTKAAQELAQMLHSADNFNQPDLERELASGSFGSQVARLTIWNLSCSVSAGLAGRKTRFSTNSWFRNTLLQCRPNLQPEP